MVLAHEEMQVIVVAYQGLSSKQGMWNSLRDKRVEYPPLAERGKPKVHEGFYRAYEALKTQTRNGLTAALAKYPTFNVHSIFILDCVYRIQFRRSAMSACRH
jgi:hypothetical protein